LGARYGQKISLEWPVFKLPKNLDPQSLQSDIQAAARLSSSLRAMYRSSQPPLYRICVTLASGVHMAYPGRGGFPPEYDGRQRPKYRLAVGQHTLRWGNAYLDLFDEPLLPCSFPLHDGEGKFVGVAGLDLLLPELAERLLPLPQLPQVEQVYLVDQQG